MLLLFDLSTSLLFIYSFKLILDLLFIYFYFSVLDQWLTMALMGCFTRIDNNEITILVNNVEKGSDYKYDLFLTRQ